MSKRELFRNVIALHHTGLMMLQKADEIQPLLEQADMRREDWERAARWLMAVSQQLVPLFPSEAILAEMTEKLAAYAEMLAQNRETPDEKPDLAAVMEEWDRE